MKHEALQHFCHTQNISFETNVSLQKYNTFRLESTADIFLRVNREQAQKLILFFYEHQLKFFVIGGGSNLLLSEQIKTPIVYVEKDSAPIVIKEENSQFFLHAHATVNSARLASFACQHNLTRAEFLSTIPGTLGGALVQNAGCYGSEMKDIVVSAKVITSQGERIFSLKELELSYRSSIFKREPWFIEEITFALKKESAMFCKKRMNDFRKKRKETQPQGKTAGSVFRNPRSQKFTGAWQVIQEIGLQGHSINGATFSKLHANFIVNEDSAKPQDIHALIKLAQERALEKGVSLQLEIIPVF